jgi:quercetin 2,3-dioxygenase
MSNLAPSLTAEAGQGDPTSAPTLEALPARRTDLGGLAILRLLPRSRRRLVGPWCFLDHYGPLDFGAGKPMDVAPHPHIGLQTVSWLLEGEVLHNDSLGGRGFAQPNTLNLMTAGRGIAHSEETPPRNGGRLHGVQAWVALPDAHRHTAPAFDQYTTLPVLEETGGEAVVIMGEVDGLRSPAVVFSPLVGAELLVLPGARLTLPLDAGFEHALVPLGGETELDGQRLGVDTLYYLGTGRRELSLASRGEPCRALLLGGAPFGETVLMWWNFVARTKEEIVSAREDWQAGRRFGAVDAYAGPRIEAPPLVA